MDMKKVVLKLYVYDEKDKQKAMKVVATLPGVESLAINMSEKQLTVTGDVDPVSMVNKLRKICRTDVITVGPAVEPAEEPAPIIGEPNRQIVEFANPYDAYYPYT